MNFLIYVITSISTDKKFIHFLKLVQQKSIASNSIKNLCSFNFDVFESWQNIIFWMKTFCFLQYRKIESTKHSRSAVLVSLRRNYWNITRNWYIRNINKKINMDGQNKQQSNLSVSIQVMLFVHGDLWSHYSVELLFINVAIGTFCMGEGWRSGFQPRPGFFWRSLSCVL